LLMNRWMRVLAWFGLASERADSRRASRRDPALAVRRREALWGSLAAVLSLGVSGVVTDRWWLRLVLIAIFGAAFLALLRLVRLRGQQTGRG
jgi:hypothetical protein